MFAWYLLCSTYNFQLLYNVLKFVSCVKGIFAITLLIVAKSVSVKVIVSTIINDFTADKYVLIATKDGLIKRIKIDKLEVNRYSKVLKATKLRDGDKVVSADICTGRETEVVIATKEGYMNRYDAEEISVIEPASFGVKAQTFPGRKRICAESEATKEFV